MAAKKREEIAKHKPIWQIAQELAASIPAEEWEKLPKDLAHQHDHYLYGTPKVED
jgi:hypothetical protein